MKKCPKCGYVRQESDVPPEYPENICPSCEIVYEKYNQSTVINKKRDERPPVKYVAEDQSPLLAKVFYWLAATGLICGILLAYKFLPDRKALDYNEEYKVIAYTWSLIWLSSAFIQSSLFAAIGKAIEYLNRIAENTSRD